MRVACRGGDSSFVLEGVVAGHRDNGEDDVGEGKRGTLTKFCICSSAVQTVKEGCEANTSSYLVFNTTAKNKQTCALTVRSKLSLMKCVVSTFTI